MKGWVTLRMFPSPFVEMFRILPESFRTRADIFRMLPEHFRNRADKIRIDPERNRNHSELEVSSAVDYR